MQGVKVEVHHIIPEASGGPNTEDNAIVLCFDCHADAGHYNPNHPRGTKFAPSELRKHRDNWRAMVQEHRIRPPDHDARLHARHLVCKTLPAFRALVTGNSQQLPFDSRVLLADNFVGRFAKGLVDSCGVVRNAHISGQVFATAAECKAKFPNAQVDDPDSLWSTRTLSREEIVELDDPVTRMLVKSGIPPEEIADAVAYYERCGEDHYQEIIRLRPLQLVFLQLWNLGEEPLRIAGVSGILHSDEPVWRPGHGSGSTEITLPLPRAPLAPGEAVVIPEGVLLAPVDPPPGDDWGESTRMWEQQVFRLSHAYSARAAPTDSLGLGPSFWAKEVTFVLPDGQEARIAIHQFDPGNTYSLDSFWAIGSCPHLYWKRATGWTYAGPVLEKHVCRTGADERPVPADAVECAVVELEQESTLITSLVLRSVEGRHLLISGHRLEEGDQIQVGLPPRNGQSLIVVVGSYWPRMRASPTPEAVCRRRDAAQRHLRLLNG